MESLETKKAAEKSAKAVWERNKARLEAEKASIEFKNAEGAKQNSVWISKNYYSTKVTFTPSTENSTILNRTPDAKIFIDGLEANRSELNKLDPRNINGIRIFKKDFRVKKIK